MRVLFVSGVFFSFLCPPDVSVSTSSSPSHSHPPSLFTQCCIKIQSTWCLERKEGKSEQKGTFHNSRCNLPWQPWHSNSDWLPPSVDPSFTARVTGNFQHSMNQLNCNSIEIHCWGHSWIDNRGSQTEFYWNNSKAFDWGRYPGSFSRIKCQRQLPTILAAVLGAALCNTLGSVIIHGYCATWSRVQRSR